MGGLAVRCAQTTRAGYRSLQSSPQCFVEKGRKDDRVDARKLSELLRAGMLRAVYHGENGLRTLRELARSYQVVSKDLMRVMNRIKALYRSWGIPCTGTQYIPGAIASCG